MPADPTALLALAARAEAGEWTSFEGAQLFLILSPEFGEHPWVQRQIGHWIDTSDPMGSNRVSAPSYGHSLDAVEEVPGRIVVVSFETSEITGERYWHSRAETALGGDHYASAEGTAPTETLARLAAKIKVMADK